MLLTTDQRGQPRQVGAGVDMGAFEREADLIAPTVTSIVRQSPTEASTNATVTLRVSFSEDVTSMSANLFAAAVNLYYR